jgi:hypothetical protein
MQGFYHGLTPKTREHLDAAAEGSFLSLTLGRAKRLMEKIADNQSWSQDNIQDCHQSEEAIEEVNALSTKMDTLLHWLDQRAKYKEDQRAIEATYKQNSSPIVRKVPHWVQPSINQGTQSGNYAKQPTLRELVLQQSKINSSMEDRFAANNKILENLSIKMDSFSSAINDQLEFNKKIEEKIAKLAVALPVATNPEQVRSITTRRGSSTRDPPYPKGARRPSVLPPVAEEEDFQPELEVLPQESVQKPVQDQEARQQFRDTNYLPFPRRKRGPQQTDEQFGKFVEVIQKLYVNIPLLDAIQVPTYAKYIRDILNKKRPLPSNEVIKLTEECSAAILNQLPEKKKDPGCPTIDCTIGDQYFNNALCDLGASVSVMPAAVYYKLNHTALEPTSMCLQLADQSVRYPLGIAENIPVKIREFFVPVDFVVLDMHPDSKVSLILGRPFLSTANAHIDVGKGEIKFTINGQEEQFAFKSKQELNKSAKMVEEDQTVQPPETEDASLGSSAE